MMHDANVIDHVIDFVANALIQSIRGACIPQLGVGAEFDQELRSLSSASIGEIWREFTYTDIRQV